MHQSVGGGVRSALSIEEEGREEGGRDVVAEARRAGQCFLYEFVSR